MNKRQIKTAIQQNKCRTFTGAKINLLKGDRILSDDLVSAIRRLNADSDSFLIHSLGRLQCVIELGHDGLNLSWVMVAGEQGNLLAAPDSTLEDGAMQELQEKLTSATREVVGSIDTGNDLAHEISQNGMTSGEVIKRLQSAPNKQVARKVAVRATGPQVSFAFTEGERQLGGNLPMPKEFTSGESISVDNCRGLRWISDKEIKLRVDSPSVDPRLSPFIFKNEFSVRVQRGTVESSILNCALFAETSFNIDVSYGLLLKKEKHVLQLARIHNHSVILEAGRHRLHELLQYQET